MDTVLLLCVVYYAAPRVRPGEEAFTGVLRHILERPHDVLYARASHARPLSMLASVLQPELTSNLALFFLVEGRFRFRFRFRFEPGSGQVQVQVKVHPQKGPEP